MWLSPALPRLRVMNADGRPQSACQFLNQEKLRKNSERRAQNQTENAVFKFGFAEPHPIMHTNKKEYLRPGQTPLFL